MVSTPTLVVPRSPKFVSSDSRVGSHLLLVLLVLEVCHGLGLAPEQAGLLLLSQPVAVPLDVDRRGVMEQAVQDGGGQDLVVEDLAPVHEALVAGDDEAGPLVTPDEEAEEQAGLFPGQRQIAELVQDQHAGIGELLQGPVDPVLVAGPHQAPHQALEGEEEHRVAGLDRLDPERDGQMRLADAGRAEQDDVLGALDEAETSQLADLLAIDRRLKVEIELLQALHPGEPGELEAALHPALVPAAPLGLEGLGEKALVVEIALGRVLADPIELVEEVLHLHALEEAGQLHVVTSSYTARGRRSTVRVSAQSAA